MLIQLSEMHGEGILQTYLITLTDENQWYLSGVPENLKVILCQLKCISNVWRIHIITGIHY